MSSRVHHLLTVLQQFKRLKANDKRTFLKTCNKEFKHGICECIRNILKARVPIQSKHLKCLTRHKQSLRKLALKGTSLKDRKKILQRSGFLGALFTPLISTLASLVGGYLSSGNESR